MELRELNRLVYLRPDNGSLVNQRTMKTYNFTNSSYTPGQTAQAILNCGNDALWGPSSYLRVEFTTDGKSVGKGSILNLFRNVRLTHRSGEVLEYVQDANVLAQILRKYAVSTEQSPKLESLIDIPAAAATYVRCVPLWMLLGVFNDQEQYIPPAFLAGAKLECDLETNAIIFSEAAGVMSDIKMELVLDSAQVYDSVQKQLLDEQADVSKSGLQYSFSTWFSTKNDFKGSSVNFDVQQSASVTEQVCAVIRQVPNIADGKDSFSFDNRATQWQYRLGSQYLPQKPVSNASTGVESYQQALIAFEASPHQHASCHGASGVNATYATFNSDDSIWAQSLEKSAAGLQLTGEPTNNSRILNLEMSKTAVGDTTDRINVFLKYLRVANVMGANLIVDR